MMTDRPLELLHMDLFGPIAYISIGGSEYCLGGDANDQVKEDEEQRPPHPRVHQAIQRDHPVDTILGDIHKGVKGKCALGPFLSILVIECQHRCLNVNLYPWMDKVQIKSKGMFLSLSTLL